METKDVAEKLAAYCRAGEWMKPYEELYSPEIVSVEMAEPMRVCRGMDQVLQKAEWFDSTYAIEDVEVLGPYVNGDQFAVHFAMTVRTKESGTSERMIEIAVYQVRDGKVVHEMFFG